ncbi:uncharacterized protein [Zea mays]|nr:uncharacterized protein LOC118476717 isoform X2 [Zea mays]
MAEQTPLLPQPAAAASDPLRIESSRIVDPCNLDVSASRFAVDLRMQPPSQCRQSALAIGVVPRALPTGRNASRWTAHATHRSSQVAFVLFTIQSMAGICV